MYYGFNNSNPETDKLISVDNKFVKLMVEKPSNRKHIVAAIECLDRELILLEKKMANFE